MLVQETGNDVIDVAPPDESQCQENRHHHSASHRKVMMDLKIELLDLFWSKIHKGSDIVDQFSL